MLCLSLTAKSGKIFGHSIIQVEAVLLIELHDGCRSRDDLGKRCQIKDGILCHGLTRGHERTVPVCFMKDDVTVVANHHHRTGYLLRLDAIGNNAIDRGKVGFFRLLPAAIAWPERAQEGP